MSWRLCLALAMLALIVLPGCGAVLSSSPTMSNTNGDAWYTEGVGFFGMNFESHIYYCPAPTSGPAECQEVVYVEGDESSVPDL